MKVVHSTRFLENCGYHGNAFSDKHTQKKNVLHVYTSMSSWTPDFSSTALKLKIVSPHMIYKEKIAVTMATPCQVQTQSVSCITTLMDYYLHTKFETNRLNTVKVVHST